MNPLFRVSLVDEYRKGVPFPLNSLLPIALVFAFMGDSEEVGTFMQKASKTTRSYYANANGFRGFVIPYSITKYLKSAKAQKQLQEVTRHQEIDMEAILKLLDGMQTNQERIEYLSTCYPCLYIFVQ